MAVITLDDIALYNNKLYSDIKASESNLPHDNKLYDFFILDNLQ